MVLDLLLAKVLQDDCIIPVEWAVLLSVDENSYDFMEDWMDHEDIDSFVDWHGDFIGNGRTMLHSAIRSTSIGISW